MLPSIKNSEKRLNLTKLWPQSIKLMPQELFLTLTIWRVMNKKKKQKLKGLHLQFPRLTQTVLKNQK